MTIDLVARSSAWWWSSYCRWSGRVSWCAVLGVFLAQVAQDAADGQRRQRAGAERQPGADGALDGVLLLR